MHHLARFARLAVLAASLAGLIAVGCAGDEEEAPASPTGTAAPTEMLAAASPADLASYRYSVDVSLLPSILDTTEAPANLPLDGPVRVVIDGERVNPGRERTRTSADMGFLQIETETIVIDGQRWIREADGTWKEGAASGLESFAGLDFRPSVLFADDEGQYAEVARQLEDYDSVEEDVSGTPTRRFTLDQDEFFRLFQEQGNVLPTEVDATLTADIWLERDLGTPVQLRVVGTDASGEEVVRLELTLSDLNAEEITVEPPA